MQTTSTNTDNAGGVSWSSYWSFFFAAVGASIGLANTWKFPYEMGLHGGGTFLLVYIPCVLLIGLPLMMSEIMIGRAGRSNPVHGIRRIAKFNQYTNIWQLMGWLGMLAGFLVFTFYSVVASWIFFYIMRSANGSFVDVPAEIVQHSFGALLRDTDQMLIWHTVFVLLAVAILSRDIRFGLERALRFLMPCLVGLVIWLCYYASQVGDVDKALKFVFTVDLSLINSKLIISAFTQALFSLGVGMGALMMYGSYLRQHRPIATIAFVVMIFDTVIAIVMAILIFSIVFAFGMQPNSGPGLIFETLPVAFSQMSSNSMLWSTLFFSLLGIAALTSAFSLLEPSIAWTIRQIKVTRPVAAWLIGSLAWLGGVFSIYSFTDLKFGFYFFGEERVYGAFDLLSIVSTQLIIPFVALLVTIFAGWRISRKESHEAMAIPLEFVYRIWLFSTRILVPLAIIAVLVTVLAYPT